jgi:protein-S-isoprenylcysteine O-methyltransferase Ste14
MLTRWQAAPAPWGAPASRWLGVALIAAGTAVVVECFLRFALRGLGTPAPIAPTAHLVVSGLYRHVRNPMYVGVMAAILGQALLLGQAVLLAYAAAAGAVFFAYVLLYEEPVLRRRFGTEYERYREAVPRWRPRATPWRGPGPR